MPTEFYALREAWLAVPEPTEEVRQDARARLLEEIVREQSAQLGQVREPTRQRRGLRPRSRFALVLVLALLLLLAWATLTLAFGWHVPFSSAPKAQHNSEIFKEFDTLDTGAPAGMESGVIADETRLVATIDGYRLWVAPTKEGGYCSALLGGPYGSGGCDRLGTVPLSASYAYAGPGPSQGGDSRGPDGAELRAINGVVDPRWSDSVEIRFEDGTVIRPLIVWVSEPISKGFFIQPIGSDHRRTGHLLSDVVALDSDGNIVERDLSLSGGMRSDDPPAEAEADQAVKVAQTDTRLGEASLWQAPNRFGTRCVWVELAGHFYFEVGNAFHRCQIKGYSPRRQAGLVQSGSVSLFYATGIPRAGSIELEFADGHRRRLRPDSKGYVLHRLATSPLNASSLPRSYTIVAGTGKKLLHAPLPFIAQ